MNFFFEDKRLMREEDGQQKEIHVFPVGILQLRVVEGRGLLVALEPALPASPDRNIFLLDFDGKIKWQISPSFRHSGEDSFGGFHEEDGKIIACAQAGNDYVLNLDDGTLKWLRVTRFG